jgi:hypothetical protein
VIAGRRRSRRGGRGLAAAGAALFLAGQPLVAQDASPIDVRGEVFVGSEIERYLRDLQVAGVVPLHPWSLRAFSPAELDRLALPDSAHPWAGRYRLEREGDGNLRVRAVRPRVQIFYNSAFPYGTNDGPVWAGRGVTAAVEAGFAGSWGPLSLTLAPMAFVAENAPFTLMDHGAENVTPFGDGIYASVIDLPQRFGDGTYFVVDPGQSTLRLDALGVAAGFSTANQHWGPATDSPILLGNNAPGFAHLFLGTSRPVDVAVGRLHGQLVWGRLRESAWAHETATPHRLLSAAVVTFTPRGAPGLEFGGARLFHAAWGPGGPGAAAFLKPFQGFLKVRRPESIGDVGDPENQLAEIFVRWTHPRAGVELWGTIAREDHSYDLRDFLLQPDHYSGYLLGVRKVWMAPAGDRLTAFRAEFVNSRVTHLSEVRQQAPFYIHGYMRQGHTHAGQLLGSVGAFGGLGSVVALDRYDGAGRWSLQWSRTLRDAPRERAAAAQGTSSRQSLGAERLHFLGGLEVGGRVAATYELNRHFAGRDVLNLNLALQVTRGL